MKSKLILVTFLICNSVFSQVPDPNMVLIPAGEFTMGKNSSGNTDWQPEHKVSVDAFYMDKFEVTNRQYFDFCSSTGNPSLNSGDRTV